jgi:hypothetical protein
VLQLGQLKCAEDPAAHLERIVDRLQARGMHAELIVPEVRLPSSGCDDQGVVGDPSARANRFERHFACVQVHVDHVAEQHARIRVAAEDVPDREGDVARAHDGGRHLVEQRLEEVMVGAVDHGHVDGARRRAFAAPKPPKPEPTMTTRCLPFDVLMMILAGCIGPSRCRVIE